ncbi:hypothetical protein PQG02_06950 [Nostoc sp. UHCC 0926]|uniref:hypothetical protein n=1 Tax=unclassified Nostoc TaxID=2593658 RepID=UPI00235FB690|nr:hypothetical protein [Nostoc sp. UHCC 0926]WDD34079.1 hypothetical protein PQG02_06950 [Nostoc sp. UHCC 0926]
MSTSSTISNLQTALGCAGKCDCCNKLQVQINAINSKLNGLKNVDEDRIVKKAVGLSESSIVPQIGTAVSGLAVAIYSKFDPEFNKFKVDLSNIGNLARTAGTDATDAQTTAGLLKDRVTRAEGTAGDALSEAVKNTRELELTKAAVDVVKGTATDAQKTAVNAFKKASNVEIKIPPIKADAAAAKTESVKAVSTATNAANEALEANNAVGGLKGIVEGLKGRVGQLGTAVEKAEKLAGDAITKAANAVGISNEALAAFGKLASRVAEIFNVVAALATLVEQLATLNVLGGRINAIENGLDRLNNEVSGVLGKLLGLQNRIIRNEGSITEVRSISLDARAIGLNAANIASTSQVTASRSQVVAEAAAFAAQHAQTTANGAEKNAETANSNATTAYLEAKKSTTIAKGASDEAHNATDVATKAKQIATGSVDFAGKAFNKATEALTVALTVLALYQGLKGLAGLRGLPGLPGRDGRNGRDGVTTVIQAPGTPGRQGDRGLPGLSGLPGRSGRNGIDGKPGKDGRDVNPADLAGLRAFIAAQHTQTRAAGTALHSATRTFILTPIMAVVTPILVLCQKIFDIVSKATDAAQLALLTIINNKLGVQVVGGLSGFIKTIAENTYVEKAVALMTFAVTVHNGFMLSNNLTQTLGTIINQCVGFILPKGIDGTPIDISKVIGKAIEDIIKDAIGVDNYTTISEDWAKANRIYQAGVNVFNQLSNMMSLLQSGMEYIGGNVGKIGNALKIWGVVGEKAYAFMNPQPNMQGQFFTFLNAANDKLNTVMMMIAIPIGVKEAITGVNDSVGTFQKSLDQQDPKDENHQPIPDTKHGGFVKYQPGMVAPTATVTEKVNAQAKADSTNIIQATLEDIFNAND